jgi:hypothetical protein
MLNAIMLALIPAVLVLVLLKDRVRLPRPRHPAHVDRAAAAMGFVIGGYDGFFGPGTGTFLTVAFSVVLGFDLLAASANARLANLASNLGGLAVFLWHRQVVLPLALYAAAAGITGNWIGSRLAVTNGARLIRPVMIGVLILLLAEVARRSF